MIEHGKSSRTRTALITHVVWAVVALAGCRESSVPTADSFLTIVSPHNDFIQKEFAEAFRDWHRAEYGSDVEVRYQQRGGTTELVRYITSEFAALRKSGREEEGIGIDLLFGGGIPAARRLKETGCARAVTLPPDVLALQPAKLAGVPLRGQDGQWYGNVLTAFGIVYNRQDHAQAGLPEPKTWEDLAADAYFGRVILADPNKSASIAVCFEMILQKHGWQRGWAILMRIAANTRDFKSRSSQVAPEVAQGVGLVGLCIDFYAHSQIAKSGDDVVGYVAPRGATAIIPDSIVVLKGCRDPEIATRFVTFTLTEGGQALWALPAGDPNGPREHTLYRMPAIPSVYEIYADRMTVRARPFTDAAAFAYDNVKETRRSPLIGPLFSAAFLKNLESCRRAWRAVIASGYDETLVREFDALPFDEEEGIRLGQDHRDDPRQAIELDQQWYRFFREKYERILSAAAP